MNILVFDDLPISDFFSTLIVKQSCSKNNYNIHNKAQVYEYVYFICDLISCSEC